MKLCDRYRASGRPTLSFEVFPARTKQAAEKLEGVLDELIAAGPDFMSVTFGAGGSTRVGSRELVARLRSRNVEVLAYFAGYGLGPEDIDGVLQAYAALGVENVLAVRGDVPRDEPAFTPHPDAMAHASDLLSFLRNRYGFCLGAAGYPEGHVQAVSKEADLGFLALKVQCGAQFVVANYSYDNEHFFAFRDRCRAAGIDVPIVAGVMPIYSVKMMETLAGICGASIPPAVRAGLAGIAEGDKEAVAQWGIDYATAQCAELLRSGVAGLHIYTMDRSASALAIVGRLRSEGLID